MPDALQIWTHTFCKVFDQLPQREQQAVLTKIDELGRELSGYMHHRLTGRPEYRLRVGNYRVIYDFDVSANRLELLVIGHRRDIYRSK